MPWERDARKRAQDTARLRSGRRRGPRSSSLLAAVVTLAGLATYGLSVQAEPAADSERPGKVPEQIARSEPPAKIRRARLSATRRYELRRLRSRFLDAATLEIWGRTNAPAGTTIRVYAAERGLRRRSLGDVPVAAGRFYAREKLPAALRSKRIEILARIVD
jgi:hypothetical protein